MLVGYGLEAPLAIPVPEPVGNMPGSVEMEDRMRVGKVDAEGDGKGEDAIVLKLDVGTAATLDEIDTDKLTDVTDSATELVVLALPLPENIAAKHWETRG